MKSPVANYDALIFITYKVRKYIPTSQIFYSLYIFVKFFGIILATHNTKNIKKNDFVSSILLYFTCFGQRGFKPYANTYYTIIILMTIISFLIHCSITLSIFTELTNGYNRSRQLGVIFATVLAFLCVILLIEIHFFFIVKVDKK